MIVPSISPIDIVLPLNPHAASVKSAASSTPNIQEDANPAPVDEQLSQNRPVDANSAAALVNNLSVSLRFKTDEISGARVIEVVNRESGDIIYQIPSEHIVDFLRYLKDTNDDKGNFVSRRL